MLTKSEILKLAQDIGCPNPDIVSLKEVTDFYEKMKHAKRARRVKLPETATEGEILRAELGLPLDATEDSVRQKIRQSRIEALGLLADATDEEIKNEEFEQFEQSFIK